MMFNGKSKSSKKPVKEAKSLRILNVMFHQKVTLSAEVIPDDVEQLVNEFLESSNAQFAEMRCVCVLKLLPQPHKYTFGSTVRRPSLTQSLRLPQTDAQNSVMIP